MGMGRHLAELVRALAVLAVVFLNFAHAPLAAPSGPDAGWYGPAALGYCGEPRDGDERGHAPCHACRIGSGADLPPPCGHLEPVRSEAAAEPAVAVTPPLARPPLRYLAARGPPAA